MGIYLVPTAGGSHEISIEDTDATNKTGFMFPKSNNGRSSLLIADYQTLTPRFMSNEQLTELSVPPEIELPWYVERWTGGIGGDTQRLRPGEIPHRYASGLQTDVTQQGKLVLARVLTSTTVDSNPNEFEPSGFAVVGTEVHAFIGRDAYSWNFSDTDWDILTEPEGSAKNYRNGVEYEDGNTYVPAWSSGDEAESYIYKADSDAQWIHSTISSNTFKYFAVADGKLWGANLSSSTRHQVRSSTDPTNSGSWSAVTSVGGSDSAINGLIGDDDTLLVLKTNGIWALYPDGTVRNLTPGFVAQSHTNNFRAHFLFSGRVFLSKGDDGLFILAEGVLHDISLQLIAPDETQLHGRVAAIHGDATNVYILVLESGSTRYHILKGSPVQDQPSYVFSWQHITRQTYTTGTDAHTANLFVESAVSGSNQHHRLWIGFENTGEATQFPYFVPLDSGIDAQDAYISGSAAGQIKTVKYDANFRRVNKHFASIEINSLDCLPSDLGGSDNYIEVGYYLDGGSFTYITGSQGTSKITSNNQTLQFASAITGKEIEIEFRFTRGSTTTSTPQLVSFTLKSRLRPAAIRSIPYRFYLADGQRGLNGARYSTLRNDLSQLRTWSDQASEVVVKIKDATSGSEVSRDMVFMPGTHQEQTIHAHNRRRPEYIVSGLLAEA